ncbi:flagellar type III secretion system pore protein FliP [Stenotrophomonas sp. MYb238]|uniref:flagellar type III secretion system pore protein FliP n=1 Tax=Stenotrophomonas sp. MYb238 TaxID=2040281 RepID=UPI001292ADB3|nr:flagellar type III secretion system pore protein FliP [Stenotrophomonas sp. MYb238]MQP74739.1 flagellar type III secretion system pore protein FliP [Stenotrophomonas sp. MYb238]
MVTRTSDKLATGMLMLCLLAVGDVHAAAPAVDAMGEAVRQDLAPALRTFLALSFLSFIPIALIGMTSFTRIIVVLALLRHALGIPQTPPNSVLITLAMFLTLFSMGPVADQVYTEAINPYLTEQVSASTALDRASDPIRGFMVRQTRESDLLAVLEMARVEPPKTMQDIRFTHLAAAFLLSELKTAFQIGFVIFLPFLLIDLVVAAILMALGMIMLPPTTISLPLKILLFILIDGWVLVSRTLLGSFWT